MTATKQALQEGVAAIRPLKCRKCRTHIDYHYTAKTKKRLARHRLCFDCLYWQELADKAHLPESVRIDGWCYWVGPEQTNEPKGFGGERFVLNFTDGRSKRRVETTNLSKLGKVPVRWRRHMRNNCRFVKPNGPKAFARAFARR